MKGCTFEFLPNNMVIEMRKIAEPIMYNLYPYFNHPVLALPAVPAQAPTSSISYKPVASSSRLLFKDNVWELQFIATTFEVTRQTVTQGASSVSIEYMDKYMLIKYRNGVAVETIYLN